MHMGPRTGTKFRCLLAESITQNIFTELLQGGPKKCSRGKPGKREKPGRAREAGEGGESRESSSHVNDVHKIICADSIVICKCKLSA